MKLPAPHSPAWLALSHEEQGRQRTLWMHQCRLCHRNSEESGGEHLHIQTRGRTLHDCPAILPSGYYCRECLLKSANGREIAKAWDFMACLIAEEGGDRAG